MTTFRPNSGLITVIIPVFNAEFFLEETVRSVLSQDYSHFELLIIDDGSTDRSGKIADEWSHQDDRIRVIHQTNAGDRKSTRLNSSHPSISRMPSSA